MPKCCIKGCESFQYTETKDITLFPFPLQNQNLLEKWLKIINVGGWDPSHLWICNMHFAKEDIQYHASGTRPTLKPSSVPTIFPVKAENTKVPDQIYYPGILMTLPPDPSSAAEIIGANENFNTQITQSGPLTLVPAEYILQCQSQFPFLVPAQFLTQLNQHPTSQNWQTNVQNPAHFGQLQPLGDTKTPATLQPLQTVIQNSEKSGAAAEPEGFPRIRGNVRSNDRKPDEQICPTLEANGPIAQQSMQDLTEVTNGNPITMTPILHQACLEDTHVQNSTETSKLTQVNAQNPTALWKLSQPSGVNQKLSAQSAQSLQQADTQNPLESVCMQYSNVNDTRRAQDLPANQPTLICSPMMKILSAPKTSHVSGSGLAPRLLLPDIMDKPDILIVPMFRNSSNKNSPELSVPSCYPNNKRPTLRITINKRYNVPPESKISSVAGEENALEDSVDKRITIKNASANKSVTFRLDRKTGEIHLENSQIVKRTNKHRRGRRMKRKTRPSFVRKTSSAKHRRATRAQRLMKKTEISAIFSPKTSKNVKVERASATARR